MTLDELKAARDAAAKARALTRTVHATAWRPYWESIKSDPALAAFSKAVDLLHLLAEAFEKRDAEAALWATQDQVTLAHVAYIIGAVGRYDESLPNDKIEEHAQWVVAERDSARAEAATLRAQLALQATAAENAEVVSLVTTAVGKDRDGTREDIGQALFEAVDLIRDQREEACVEVERLNAEAERKRALFVSALDERDEMREDLEEEVFVKVRELINRSNLAIQYSERRAQFAQVELDLGEASDIIHRLCEKYPANEKAKGKKSKWTRREAIHLLNHLERHLAPDYHVGLAGSILLQGQSQKDLDIIIYPHSAEIHTQRKNKDRLTVSALERQEVERIHTHLVAAGLTRLLDSYQVAQHWRTAGSNDTKHVEVWELHNKRIDVFFLT